MSKFNQHLINTSHFNFFSNSYQQCDRYKIDLLYQDLKPYLDKIFLPSKLQAIQGIYLKCLIFIKPSFLGIFVVGIMGRTGNGERFESKNTSILGDCLRILGNEKSHSQILLACCLLRTIKW
tara:strand:- start:1156 stop:1521 length:366 start_codon:yes stop_codon:yes gene_type:complete